MKYEYDESLFDEGRRSRIIDAKHKDINENIFSLMIQVDKDGYPVFNQAQMYHIIQGCHEDHLTEEQVKFYMQLNSNTEPIFDDEQMMEIRYIFKEGYDADYVKDTLGKIKNDTAVFNDLEMNSISFFFKKANEKQKEEIRMAIKEDLPYKFFDRFMNTSFPAKNMRVYRSLYSLGCSESSVKSISLNNTSYEELKDLKYLFSCAKQLDIDINRYIDSTSIYVDKLQESLSEEIEGNRWRIDNARILIDRFLSYRMPPEQIEFLCNPKNSFCSDEMEKIAIGFLNGLTIPEMQRIIDNAILYYPEDKVLNLNLLCKNIEDTVKDKISANINDNEEIEIKTNWFEELEK